MEKILFKKIGPIDKFIEWIERFKGEISKDSLIIEIDSVEKKFISKTYAMDRSLVRYSEISFTEANLEIVSVDEKAQKQRVFIGIYLVLPKFIELLKTFASALEFTMSVDYEPKDLKTKDLKTNEDVVLPNQLCANSINFVSKKLKMKIPGCSLNATKMFPLSDDVFNNKVWSAPQPVSVKVTGEHLKTLVNISDILASSEKLKNFMQFYTTTNAEGKRVMMVKDSGQESYDYELGEIVESAETPDTSLEIYRERFLVSVKNAYDDTTLIFSTIKPNRLLIQLGDGATKTIVSRVKR